MAEALGLGPQMPLKADRIDFPTELTGFDPRPFLSPESAAGFWDPDTLLLPEEDRPPAPEVRRRTPARELVALARRWDAVGKVVLGLPGEVDPSDAAEVWPVVKPGLPFPAPGVDRQILDRRRRNAKERRVVTGSRFLPHSVTLGEL